MSSTAGRTPPSASLLMSYPQRLRDLTKALVSRQETVWSCFQTGERRFLNGLTGVQRYGAF